MFSTSTAHTIHMQCILIFLLSLYMLNFHSILGTLCTKNYMGWAISSSPAAKSIITLWQRNHPLHCTTRHQAPVSKGANKRVDVFCPQEPSSIQQVFFYSHWGFSSFFPSAFISKGGTEDPICLWAHKPLPCTLPQHSKKSSRSQGSHPFSKGGHQATAKRGGKRQRSLYEKSPARQAVIKRKQEAEIPPQ